eukprot:jgi/Bigna1/70586/fgenesh1_pg.12_\
MLLLLSLLLLLLLAAVCLLHTQYPPVHPALRRFVLQKVHRCPRKAALYGGIMCSLRFAADTTNTEFAYDFHEMSGSMAIDEFAKEICFGVLIWFHSDKEEDAEPGRLCYSKESIMMIEDSQPTAMSDGDITSMIKAGLRAQGLDDVLRDKQASRFGSHFTGNFERDMYSALGCKLGCSHHRGMQSSSGSSAAGNGGYGLSNIGTVVCERKECLANALACSVETGQFRAKESSAMIQRLYLQQQLLQQGHPLHAGNHGSGASEQYDALASTLAGRFSSPIAGNAAGFANSGVLAGAPAGLPTGCHDFVCEQCKCKKNHGGGAEAAAGQLTLSNGGGTSACISQGVRAMQRRDRRIMMANGGPAATCVSSPPMRMIYA